MTKRELLRDFIKGVRNGTRKTNRVRGSSKKGS